MCPKMLIRGSYEKLTRWAGPVVLSLVLLLVRIIWGWQFFLAGKGKLADISQPIHYFAKLGIPMPTFNAWLCSLTECIGGLLLLLGLCSRPICIALTINMIVAYVAADRDSLRGLFTDGNVNDFANATPFWFLVISLLVLALGPGMFSIDAILKRFCCRTKHDAFPIQTKPDFLK